MKLWRKGKERLSTPPRITYLHGKYMLPESPGQVTKVENSVALKEESHIDKPRHPYLASATTTCTKEIKLFIQKKCHPDAR
jgi:hypothetical protein